MSGQIEDNREIWNSMIVVDGCDHNCSSLKTWHAFPVHIVVVNNCFYYLCLNWRLYKFKGGRGGSKEHE